MRVDGAHRLMHQPQCPVDVLEHADGVGDHDVVERSLDRGQRRRIFHVAQNEIELGMQLLGLGDGLGAEIDADAVGWLQRREQISPAAAQFQHPLSGRNQELHELAVVFAVGSVELAASDTIRRRWPRNGRAGHACVDLKAAVKQWRRIASDTSRPQGGKREALLTEWSMGVNSAKSPQRSLTQPCLYR